MRKKRQYIVLSFASTARAMGWEKECAARGIPGRIIPLPGEITAGCGLGWRMLPEDWEAWNPGWPVQATTPQRRSCNKTP